MHPFFFIHFLFSSEAKWKKERTAKGRDIPEEAKSDTQDPPSIPRTAQALAKIFDRPALNSGIDLRNPSKHAQLKLRQ